MALPWEKSDEESAPAFAAFATYRDLGVNRSIAKACEIEGKNPSLLKRWSGEHNWVVRVNAYDRHLDNLLRQSVAEEIVKMGERHASQARVLQGAAVADLGKLRELQKNAGADELLLTPELIGRFLEIGARMERQARGEPGDVVGLLGGDDGEGAGLTRALATDEAVRKKGREFVQQAGATREEQIGDEEA